MKAEYIDHMGSDLSVVNAARVSFDKQSDWHRETVWKGDEWSGWSETTKTLKESDANLIRYLARGYSTRDWDTLLDQVQSTAFDGVLDPEEDGKQRLTKILMEMRRHATHWSPFTHTAVSLRLTMPIAIARQFTKHRVGFDVNEVSRRYVDSRPELFVPEFRSRAQNVKQGSGDRHPQAGIVSTFYQSMANTAIKFYEELIEDGVCPEQARFILPQGVMTEMIVTANVFAWSRFYVQRTDPHAQKEIGDLAREVGKIIQPLFPVSWEALTQ